MSFSSKTQAMIHSNIITFLKSQEGKMALKNAVESISNSSRDLTGIYLHLTLNSEKIFSFLKCF